MRNELDRIREISTDFLEKGENSENYDELLEQYFDISGLDYEPETEIDSYDDFKDEILEAEAKQIEGLMDQSDREEY